MLCYSQAKRNIGTVFCTDCPCTVSWKNLLVRKLQHASYPVDIQQVDVVIIVEQKHYSNSCAKFENNVALAKLIADLVLQDRESSW